MKDKEYNKWKHGVNNNSEVRKRKDILINKSQINNNPYLPPLSRPNSDRSYWAYFRDSTLLIFIFVIVLLFAMRTFYPDSYRDVLSPVCKPSFNYTDESINYNNASCNNFCELECNFPDKLKIEMVNAS